MCKKKQGRCLSTNPVGFLATRNRITLEKRLFGQGHFFDSPPMFDHFRFFDLHRTCGRACSSYPPLPFFQECGLCMNIAVDPHLNADPHYLSILVPYENRSHPFFITLFIHSGRGGLSVTWVLSVGWKEIFFAELPEFLKGLSQQKVIGLRFNCLLFELTLNFVPGSICWILRVRKSGTKKRPGSWPSRDLSVCNKHEAGSGSV